jgi:hypothetical protein
MGNMSFVLFDDPVALERAGRAYLMRLEIDGTRTDDRTGPS